MNLRPYQQEALRASLARWKAGVSRQVIVHPTGVGKSLLFSTLRSHHGFDGKVMILVHREELANQAAAHVKRWNPDLNVGVEMADRRCSDWDDVIVASVQTVGRAGSKRIEQFWPEKFSAIVVDEAHHASATTYRTIFEYFGVDKPGSPRLLLGVTATPNRSDGTPLAEVFDEIVHQFTIRSAIESGWLVDLKATQVHTKVNLDGVKIRAGDFATGELEDRVNTSERNKLIVASWRQKAAPRQAVAFCVDVQHARDLAREFQAGGVNCEAVWGEMPNRAEVLAAFRAKRLQVLTSVAVLTEGWDYPALECVLLCRPTKSRLVMTQAIGRGTRLPDGTENLRLALARGEKPSKTDCLVIDFVDLTSRHTLAGVGSLVGLGDAVDLMGKSLVATAKTFEDALAEHPGLNLENVRDLDELQIAISEIDLFRDVTPPAVASFAKMSWHQAGADSFSLSLPDRAMALATKNLLGHWEVRFAEPQPSTSKYHQATEQDADNRAAWTRIAAAPVPPEFGSVEDAVGWTERLLAGVGYGVLLSTNAKWRSDPATEAQLRFLKRLGVHPPPGLDKGSASRAIDARRSARRG